MGNFISHTGNDGNIDLYRVRRPTRCGRRPYCRCKAFTNGPDALLGRSARLQMSNRYRHCYADDHCVTST